MNQHNLPTASLFDEETQRRAYAIAANQECLASTGDFYAQSPFSRPSRPQDLPQFVSQAMSEGGDLPPSLALFGHRLLFTGYEQELVFLPQKTTSQMKSYRSFYDSEARAAAAVIRPALEKKLFGWMDREIELSGKWTLDAFREYSEGVLEDLEKSDSTFLRLLHELNDKKSAVQFFIVQCASDFLCEASAMARNVLGNYGPELSELFKILIDEYGYGVHEKKHSTLFEELMRDAELNPMPHYYWQFYNTGSLSLANYFQFISGDHNQFFRYLGALYFTEASLAFITRHQSAAIKLAFGRDANTLYFDEHTHIDTHHGRMAFENLIVPIVEKCGTGVLGEIVKGFEEFRTLLDRADEEMLAQIAWLDKADKADNAPVGTRSDETMVFTEDEGELSVTHCHDLDEWFEVEKGAIDLVCSPFKRVHLEAGEGMVLPKGMLHGSIVVSDKCTYRVAPVA